MSGITMEEFSVFCKKKGFVFPSTEIYGGVAGCFDYGPLGVELKNSLKASWWKRFVQSREDMLGIDGCIISSQKIWEASGHLANFQDLLTRCEKCGKSHRADHLVEDKLKISVDGLDAPALDRLIRDNGLRCPLCGGGLREPKPFNLMFPIVLGPDASKEASAFLRGETAQLIFVDFKNVVDTGRVKLPFGIAQAGKAFRNEISPRDFLFRTREFEQMEIEYFLRPEDDDCPHLGPHLGLRMQFLSEEDQAAGRAHSHATLKDLLDRRLLGNWHAYWLAESYLWYLALGIREENLRVRQHIRKELSHYSSATFDVEYRFPMGWKEIHGNADRGQFDLRQHQAASGKSMELFDEETKQKLLPRVIEPSFGVDRAFLAVLYDTYEDDKARGNIVLKLRPRLAPVQVGVFQLVNKLDDKAREVFASLKEEFVCTFDRAASIGRRYARADEIGIPFCVTVDFQTLEDGSVTIRDRDSTIQRRIGLSDLTSALAGLLAGQEFGRYGTPVEAPPAREA